MASSSAELVAQLRRQDYFSDDLSSEDLNGHASLNRAGEAADDSPERVGSSSEEGRESSRGSDFLPRRRET